MLRVNDHLQLPPHEIAYRTSRSSGPGGQHVNTAETRVEARFNVRTSPSLSGGQRARLLRALEGRLTTEGELIVVAQDERSQHRNKELATERLCSILARALTYKPPRKKTRPTRASKRRRLDNKKHRGKLKNLRGKVER
ncbi:MAG: aminoacyl-tRNA hydrolase [Deltaproteobacteria bacterium]|nr:MAG: aminoacyl-tRNA hydrolase [Deltaproteobacteria bacterium]